MGCTCRRGLVQGHHGNEILRFLTFEAFRIRDFDDLPIPFRAVATEIGTGATAVLGEGDLARAMSASMAIPGVFAPVVVDGVALVDGLVVQNVPISTAREMGADVIIAVDIGSKLLEPDEIGSLLAVTEQMINILTQENVDEQLAKLTDRDLLIQPDLGDITLVVVRSCRRGH